MTPVLQIDHISKTYGSIRALNEFSLTVNPGSVYGILGPNGSGKTTTLSIILGVLQPDSGSYRWFGENPAPKLCRRIGSILEQPNFLPYLSGYNNLKISADIKEAEYSDIDRVLEIVNLADRKKSAFRTYSLGMKQRLALASALLGDPDVLVLDEPTNGLDPQGIYDVRSIIRRVADEGKTIILASHILDEIEKVCSHVAILKSGEKLTGGTTREILSKNDTLEISASDLDKLQQNLAGMKGVIALERENGIVVATLEDDADVAEINAALVEKGIRPNHLVRQKQSLESHFIEITGGNRS